MLVPVDGGEFQVNDSQSARSCKKPNSYKSDPKGAEVYVNGRYMEDTPCRLKLESRESYVIEFVKQGYDTKSVNVTNHVAVGWIVLDVLAGLVSVVVDAATGSWYELDQKNINVMLRKYLVPENLFYSVVCLG